MTATCKLWLTPSLQVLFVALTALSLTTAAASAEAPIGVPADGRIALTDYAGRNWGPELVHYTIDTTRFAPGRLVLLDENGKAVPFQIKTTDGKGLLMFVATAPKGKSVTYKLQPASADRSRENSAIVNRAAGDHVEVGNEWLTLRLPRPRKQQFTQPVDAQEVAAPILGWKQAGYDWQGGSRFVTERLVTQCEVQVLDDGPATVAYEARYGFQPAGQYVCQVRVCAGIPVALVTEEFDFGKVTDGQDYLMLGLGEKWAPQQIGFTSGESPTAPIPLEPLASYVEKKSKEQSGPLKNVGAYVPPEPFMPGKKLVLLERIVPGMPWGVFKSGCELRTTRGQGEKAVAQSTSVFPLHTGSWRRMMSLVAWHDPARGVQIALPISVRLSRWYLDMVDDRSPFSSHEHDGTLPPTYGRREWGLGFGLGSIGLARVQLGCIGLDRYKNWVLDWPENRSRAVYPGGLVTPAVAARVKQALAQHPERELLEKLYIIDGKPETALENAKRALETFRQPSRGDEWWRIVSISSYYVTYQHLWTIWANSALACPTLPTEQRRELRRYLALYAYLFSDPDFDPRGSGCHQGNPNMAVGRSMSLSTVAPMLADHPRYAYWMNQLRGMATFRLASNTEPGGAWFEPPIYQMYGPTRAVNIAQIVLRNCGIADLTAEGWHKAALTYDANLTMPDVRFKGWRILPGMGNSGNTLEGIFGISVAAFDQSDREFAGFLRAMHRLVSGNNRVSQGNDPDYSFCLLPDIAERPRTLRTTFVPGYGVAFRAHFGSPDETAMLFRCGFNKSHWDMDDLNTVLYGKGAPLSPGTGYQYYYGPAMQNDAIYHNRVKVGRLDAHEPFGRVENHVQDYGFGESVDYAVGREYYPPEYFTDGNGEMEWRRHVVFLKSARPEGANYFVLRDTFPGGARQPTWWHWLNLDGPEMIVPRANTIEMKPGLTRLSDGYEKQTVSVDLGEGVTVTGEAPFEAQLDGRAIRIKTRGRARVLDVTLPPFILRPELKLDGRQWMAAWTDYAGSNWGRMKNAWLAAVSTLDGEHELVITNMVFPPVWQRPFEPVIVSTAKDGGTMRNPPLEHIAGVSPEKFRRKWATGRDDPGGSLPWGCLKRPGRLLPPQRGKTTRCESWIV